MQHPKVVLLLLRVGLASVFLYAAASAIITPSDWIGFLPQALRNIFPANTLLFGFSCFQLLLVAWLLSNWKIFYASLFTALTTLGIIFTNLGALSITFRDFTIFFTALALAVATYERK